MSLAYLYIFLQSNLLEVPIYYLFFRKQKSIFQTLLLVTAINSLTHPIVFFGIMNLSGTYLNNILFAETFAILAETLFFYKVCGFAKGKSFRAAFYANFVSWQVAPMITYYLINFT